MAPAVLLACAIGIAGSLLALMGDRTSEIETTWRLPLGAVHVGIDALSAFFLLCVFLVSGLATLYGIGYLGGLTGRRRLARQSPA